MKKFRIMNAPQGCPKEIPFVLISGCEEQAQINHQQTLDELNRRGGLTPVEIWLVAHRLKTYGHDCIPTEERAVKWLNSMWDESWNE